MEPRTTTEASFLGLPIEVREMIYQFCFTPCKDRQYKSLRYEPKEPDITRVSKFVRTESLPLHYAACSLDVHTYVKCGSGRNVWLTTNKWYYNLTTAKIGFIRTIKLRFGFSEWYFGEPVAIEFTIKLDKRSQACHLKHSFGAGWYSDANRKGDPADCEEVLQVLTKHLTRSLRSSISEKGIGSFDHVDLDRLIDVDPDSIP